MIELFTNRRTRQPMQFLLVLFLFYFIPFLLDQILLADNIRYFNDDMLILSWTYHIYDKDLLNNDYITEYLIKTSTMPSYYLLVKIWTLFLSPLYLHKFMPLALWLISSIAVYIVAFRLAGRFNAVLTLSYYLLSQVFLSRMAGGLEHTFAFPLLLFFLASLLSGKTWLVSACVVLCAIFYPPVTPVAGITMALWMLFPKFSLTGRGCTHNRWTFLKKFSVLAVTAIISAACVAPMAIKMMSHTEYGAAINPLLDNKEFPELEEFAPKNVIMADRNPWMFFFFPFVFQYEGAFGAIAGFFVAVAIGVMVVMGIIVKSLQDSRVARLQPFFMASVGCFFLGYFFKPDEVYRHLLYPMTILTVLMIPLVMRKICRLFVTNSNQKVILLAIIGGHMVFLGHTNSDAAGYFFKMSDSSYALVKQAARMDKEAMFAGLPFNYKDESPIELLPYFSQRKVFFSHKANFHTHKEYTLVMRKRMLALIDAYYAADIKALHRLQNEFGVTHLLINTEVQGRPTVPSFSEPFNEHFKKIIAPVEIRQQFYSKLVDDRSVYTHGAWHIIDISHLGD